MLFEGQDYVLAAPWLVAAPATVILLAVWGFNMLGEGLRDALDPREA
jgi:peptide/nickel transport system permease protein